MNNEFHGCASCTSKPGTPTLCPSCIHNRRVIERLSNNAENLGKAMQKFAPDLMEELVSRHRAAEGALTHFLEFLRHE